MSHRSGMLGRAPSGVLVVGAIASVQFGSAIAATLFAQIGPAGAVWLRLLFGTIVLVALWRPRFRGRTRYELLLATTFGLVLACMNLSFYEALHRIPLGIAVTIEFVGPLGVAVAGSRRALDLIWVALAAAGIIALTRGGTGHLDALGVFFALLAGCFWATYILDQRARRPRLRGWRGPGARDVRLVRGDAPVRHRSGRSSSARAAIAGPRRRGRGALLRDPVLVRDRGAAGASVRRCSAC